MNVLSKLVNSSQGSVVEEMSKDMVDTELAVTDSQNNQMIPEDCNRAQEPETSEHTEVFKTPSEDEKAHQQMQNGQNRVVEADAMEEPEHLDERILVDPSDWYQGYDVGENVLSAESFFDEKTCVSPGKEPGFDLASSSDSCLINTTESIMQQTAVVLCETTQLSPAETQETTSRMALMTTK